MIGDIMARIIGLTSPGGGLAQVYRYFTTLAAASSKYYEIDNISLTDEDEVSITFQAPTSMVASESYLLDAQAGGAARPNTFLAPSGDFSVRAFWKDTMVLDGVPVPRLGTPYPVDGQLHTLVLTADRSIDIDLIGAKFDLSSTFSDILADFKVVRAGVLIHDIPLNGNRLNSDVRDAGGAVVGTTINIVQADAELFKLNTSTSPDQWENLDLTRIIPIAGTP